MPQLVEAQVADVDATDQHPPAGDVVEPRDERGERGLARADGADQRHRLARPQLEVDAAQHVLIGAVVAEPDVLEHQRRAPLGRHRLGRVEDGRLGVEHLEDPAPQALAASSVRASSQPSMMIGHTSCR